MSHRAEKTCHRSHKSRRLWFSSERRLIPLMSDVYDIIWPSAFGLRSRLTLGLWLQWSFFVVWSQGQGGGPKPASIESSFTFSTCQFTWPYFKHLTMFTMNTTNAFILNMISFWPQIRHTYVFQALTRKVGYPLSSPYKLIVYPLHFWTRRLWRLVL